MAFDGVVTRAIVFELNQMIKGGKIRKIYQPHKRDITLIIRAQGKNHSLHLSADPIYPRLHLTTFKQQNPQEPPPFCMILRKFCKGGWIESIQQVGMDRIVHLNIRTRNELGDHVHKRIVIEMMGKHSNIILMDCENNTILDSIVHVTEQVSRVRQVLPGIPYTPPPHQQKMHPLEIEYDQFIAGFDYNRGKLDQQIVHRFTGIGPLMAKEILHRSRLPKREQLWKSFQCIMNQIQNNQYQPMIIETKEKKVLTVIPFTFIQGKSIPFSSVNACVDHYYTVKAQQNQLKQKRQALQRMIQKELTKHQKKLKQLKQKQTDQQKAKQAQLFGELLMASLHQVKRGDTEIEVVNYFDPALATVKIPLDPALTPTENAEQYFKRYRKLKDSQRWQQEQKEKTTQMIQYLETIQTQLTHANQEEIDQIREELTEVGIIKPNRTNTKKKRVSKLTPLKVYSSDKTLILVGKNNRQNDYLTQKIASSQDTWLHAKEIPGSHVVIRSSTISETTLMEAAMLAAYFSKARESSQVPVDYTLIKHVKKPKGAHPGFVIYKNQKTLFVTPDREKIEKMLNRTH